MRRPVSVGRSATVNRSFGNGSRQSALSRGSHGSRVADEAGNGAIEVRPGEQGDGEDGSAQTSGTSHGIKPLLRGRSWDSTDNAEVPLWHGSGRLQGERRAEGESPTSEPTKGCGMGRSRALTATMMVALLALTGMPGSVRASVPNPKVKGPIGETGIHGYPLWDSWFDLADLGYRRRSTSSRGTRGPRRRRRDRAVHDAHHRHPPDRRDRLQRHRALRLGERHRAVRERGRHAHDPRDAAPRGLRLRPRERAVGRDLLHAAHAEDLGPGALRALSHPGDDYAYDMFSQIVQALKSPDRAGSTRWAGSRSKWLLAAGQSQSASRLDDYVREWQPSAGVIDGFLIHGGGSKTYEPPPAAPVLHLLSDAEADAGEPEHDDELPALGDRRHRPLRLLHRLSPGLRAGPARCRRRAQAPGSADADLHVVAGNYGEQLHPMHATCIVAGRGVPDALRGAPPRCTSSIAGCERRSARRRTGRASSSRRAARARRVRNALGGIRLPPIDVPVATIRLDRLRRSAGSRSRSPTRSCGSSTRPTPTTTPDAVADRRGGRRRLHAARGRDRSHDAGLCRDEPLAYWR